jgi:hypothetical protein
MKLILDDSELSEIKIQDVIKSNDKGIVVPNLKGKRGKGEDNLTKKLAAIDAIEVGSSKAALIHNIPQSSASKYKDGLDVGDDETRAEILGIKHNIADKAIAKLMDTLDLFNPSGIEKQVDVARAASQMAGIVERVSGLGKNGGNNVHLHLHAPNQRKVEEYDVIDV